MTERVPWKESNLALVGSDLDHKIKAAAAEGEPQWDGIGEEEGTNVWRIEQFRVVPWPDPGKFHTGDSYVVLNTYKKNDKLCYDIHIWIGKESSQDEYGTAAYKMVECDEKLGGAAVQHRETQGHESPLFQSYFGYQLEYWSGGTASGFRHVEATVDEPHLYRIKGTEKGLSMTQMPLAKDSLNHGDSFILYCNASTVFVWHGSSANPDEKAKANTLGESMCTEGTVVVLDEGEDGDAADYWKYFGDEGEIADADDLDETIENFCPLLFQLSADSEPEQISKAADVKMRFGAPDPPMDKGLLSEDGMFLLDAGWELFLWMGAEADKTDKLSAMAQADVYAREDPRTVDLPLTLVKSGWESSSFSKYFA